MVTVAVSKSRIGSQFQVIRVADERKTASHCFHSLLLAND